jgi:ADP-dependent NAD(P)H-hydrate dehydratase / NAD(P)H-hydrate epimerase
VTELLTAAQMRAIEQAAIESGVVTGLELMERAGQGVVEAIFEEWPAMADAPAAGGEGGAAPPAFGIHPQDISEQKKRKAVVLCGPGNNGGDGFVVARLLHGLGWEVEVFLYGDADKLPPDARVNYERWGEIGEVRSPLPDGCPYVGYSSDLLIDALFGIGLSRPVELGGGYAGTASDDINGGLRGEMKHVSIDMPSGLCSDSGKVLGDPFLADLTIAFHRIKIGHSTGYGPEICGKLCVADIGLQHKYWHAGSVEPWKERVQLTHTLWGRITSEERLGKRGFSALHGKFHKYSHGHALILSGGAGKTGAARLASRGALRIGAGLVTLGVPHEAQAEVAAQITALMMREIGDVGALKLALEDERVNTLCLGPGLGLERARELLPVALDTGLKTHPTRGVVLDADALSAYADVPQVLFDMLHARCVLTPHGGEFARLFPDIAAKLNAPAIKGPAYSKVDATREAAKRAGCVVLFKGPDTVIAAPDGRCAINSAAYEREAPWLATAGSGDVLAGFITGLLARGFDPMQAAETAAWLHVECALKFGPGLIAEDLPEQLPAVFRDLGV